MIKKYIFYGNEAGKYFCNDEFMIKRNSSQLKIWLEHPKEMQLALFLFSLAVPD